MAEPGRGELFAQVANLMAGRDTPPPVPACPELLPSGGADQWMRNGYVVLRHAVDDATCAAINERAIAMVRDIATGEGMNGAFHKDGSFTVPEENFAPDAGDSPEDRTSKLFNLHRHDPFREVAMMPPITSVVAGVLGPDIDCFNSQFIFKNPGAWGQPWHQDSLYFNFDRYPQVGVWVATSPATEVNGCLYIAPGSHTEPLHRHVPDFRPGANLGYLEVVDYDFSGAVPVLMDPGDVLVFHSFLLHRSGDNTSSARRTALVFHYGQAGTQTIGGASSTIDWMPARS